MGVVQIESLYVCHAVDRDLHLITRPHMYEVHTLGSNKCHGDIDPPRDIERELEWNVLIHLRTLNAKPPIFKKIPILCWTYYVHIHIIADLQRVADVAILGSRNLNDDTSYDQFTCI